MSSCFKPLNLGHHWSFNIRNDPKRFVFVLARYRFAAQVARQKTTILELGCSEGIGASMLVQRNQHYTGVDLDASAIASGRENFSSDRYQFIHDDFMGKVYGNFGTVVSLDVVEHILPEYEGLYFETLARNLQGDGVCVVGTPNITAAPYASKASQMGHVNLFSQNRLCDALAAHFHFVFPFGMNDEVVHTGFASMCHYLICIACRGKYHA